MVLKYRKLGCTSSTAPWQFNEHTGRWSGNPALETLYSRLFESLKKERNRKGTKKQAEPMLPEHLQELFQWLDSEAGQAAVSESKRLEIKAILVTAFILMGRYVQ